MGHVVGTKGQVVIAKEIRDQLGIEPGMETAQRVVDGEVVLYFIPKRGRRSLAGALAKYVTRPVSDDELRQGIEDAWAEEAEESERQFR